MEATPMEYLPTEAPDNGFLADFLSRPVLVYNQVWTSAAPINAHFDPWALFLNDPGVNNKITNFARLRATINVELQINGTPFHYGAILASYEPANGLRRSIDGDWRQHSNLSHGFLNPTNSQSVRLTGPFMHPKNWIDLTSTTGAQLGVVNLDTVVGLLSASTTVEPVTVTGYAWLSDVQLAFPTNQIPAVFVAQAKKVTKKKRKGPQVGKDEYTATPNQGLISAPANAIANIAGRLTDVPVIGSWATATQIGASAVGKIASLFGYSRPVSLEGGRHYLALPSSQMATTDSAVNAVPLSIGSKAELTIDPKAIGYNTSEDELSLNNIVRKPTLMAVETIGITNPSGTGIFSTQVHPGSFSTNSLGAGVNLGVLDMSALAFATVPFKYWAGTIVYRFQIVCSKYHRGRIRVQYSPDPSAILSTALNTTYNHIVDISPGKEFEIVIPYASDRPALQVEQIGGSAFTSNGTLRAIIQNEISAPDSLSDIYLLCWIYGGDDYRVFNPSEQEFQFCGLTPQSAHETGDGETEYESVQFFNSSLGDAYDLTIIGDPVKSFRPLIKRYTLHAAQMQDDSRNGPAATTTLLSLTLAWPMYPQRTGEVTYGTSIGNATQLVANVNYNHLMNWLEPSFLAKRGSCRWIFDGGDFTKSASGVASCMPVASRTTRDDVRVIWNQASVGNSASIDRALTVDSLYQSLGTSSGFSGTQVFSPDSVGVPARPEIQLPFYFPYRYATNFGEDSSPYYPRVSGTVTQVCSNSDATSVLGMNTVTKLYCAAGEDFTMNCFLGVPQWIYSTDPNPYIVGSDYEVGTTRIGEALP